MGGIEKYPARPCRLRENAVLRSVTAAVLIGVLPGFWFALVNGSIELFQNYVEGVWRYQVEIRSFAAPVIGAVIGALVGTNIRLSLARKRVDAFVRGALAGCAVGALLVAGQAVLVARAALLQVYDVEYGFLLIRFVGILTAAALIGAAVGLLEVVRLLGRPVVIGAVIGALTSIAFVLPVALGVGLAVPVASLGALAMGAFVITTFVLTNHLPVLLAGIVGGAIVGAVHNRNAASHANEARAFVGIVLAAVIAVTASSLSFHFVILGLESPDFSFSLPILAILVFRTLVGSLCGCAIGLVIIFTGRRRDASTRRSDTDMISSE